MTLGLSTRARPHLLAQGPADGRTRTELADLPQALSDWLATRFGRAEITPVPWLVNRNHCFRVRSDAIDAIVKVVAGPDATPRVDREARVLEHLTPRGLPVPRLIDTCDLGDDLACIATEWIDALPLRFMDAQGELADDYARELGALIGTLHRALAELDISSHLHEPPALQETLVLAAAESLLGNDARNFFAEWLPLVNQMLASFPQRTLHGDVQDKNLLLNDQGQLFLCDFEAVQQGPVLLDLCLDRILLQARIEPERLRALQSELCQGYGSERIARYSPDAWTLMRVGHSAHLLQSAFGAGAQEFAPDQREHWFQRMESLRSELASVFIPGRNRREHAPIPMWYAGRGDVLEGVPSLVPLRAEAARLWPDAHLRVDSQSATLRKGACIGIPHWQSCWWAGEGALLLSLADEQLIEVCRPNGRIERPDPNEPLLLRSSERIRFLPASAEQTASLVLVRPRLPSCPLPTPRECARLFRPEQEHAPDDWQATGTIAFESRAQVLAQLQPATFEEILAEPSVSGCRIDQALAIGGPLLWRFVDALPADWTHPEADVVVGVKRDELAPGFSPAPVGFHIDGTHIANKLPDGRPDLRNPGNTVDQILVCFGDAAPTRFMLGNLNLREGPIGAALGQRWQREMEAQADAGLIERWSAPPNAMVKFGFGAFHTGSISSVRGWRCFIKAMRGRGEILGGGPAAMNTVSWPASNQGVPTDPCGVFPDIVP